MSLYLVFEHVHQDLANYLEKCPAPGLGQDRIKVRHEQLAVWPDPHFFRINASYRTKMTFNGTRLIEFIAGLWIVLTKKHECGHGHYITQLGAKVKETRIPEITMTRGERASASW